MESQSIEFDIGSRRVNRDRRRSPPENGEPSAHIIAFMYTFNDIFIPIARSALGAADDCNKKFNCEGKCLSGCRTSTHIVSSDFCEPVVTSDFALALLPFLTNYFSNDVTNL